MIDYSSLMVTVLVQLEPRQLRLVVGRSEVTFLVIRLVATLPTKFVVRLRKVANLLIFVIVVLNLRTPLLFTLVS